MPEQFHYNPPGSIFVFGSNLAGIHGAGAAKTAVEKYGAIMGQGKGRQGNSYAIPTKDFNIETLPLDQVQYYVQEFVEHAWFWWRMSGTEVFYVTKIGCGLAGFTEEQIKPMFKDAPPSCLLPDGWR